jgi:hypothetical protein
MIARVRSAGGVKARALIHDKEREADDEKSHHDPAPAEINRKNHQTGLRSPRQEALISSS